MSATTLPPEVRDPYKLGRGGGGGGGHGGSKSTGHGEGGPASKYIITGYGFWIFLLSDFIMFSAFFAAYGVLAHNYAGGPTGAQLFDLRSTALETAVLLLSSFTCGLSSVAASRRQTLMTELWLLVTGLLGAVFLVLETTEFRHMVHIGAGPSRSGFLSAFFAVVGLHGLHVTCGLLWLGTMMAQIWVKGFRPNIRRRFHCFNLFWHALDIIWVGLFTVVYLLGAG
jgi:cytochrome o ubiquinol oxidase subunit 3